MTRYELATGQGSAFVRDDQVIGFVAVDTAQALVVTSGGELQVKGSADDLHDAWMARRTRMAEAVAKSRVKEH